MSSQRRVVPVQPDAPGIVDQHEVRDAEDRLLVTVRQYPPSAGRPPGFPADVPFFADVSTFHSVSGVVDAMSVVYEVGPNPVTDPNLLGRLADVLRAGGWTVASQQSPPPGIAAINATRGDRQRAAILLENGDVSLMEMPVKDQ